jgi:hypothetical protein
VRNSFLCRIGLASLLVFLSLASTAVFANDYFVSSVGNDSNDGSQTRPWKTIPKALGSASISSTGTTIHVGAGTYSSGIDITRGGASPSGRLVLQCDPGAASATAAIGQCKITGSVFGVLVEASNVDVVGFDIGGNPNMNGAIETTNGTTANSVHFIGNYLHDLGANVTSDSGVMGCPETGVISFGPWQDQQANGNIILNFGINPAPSGCNVAQGIYPAAPGAIIQNNIIIKVPVGGIQVRAACNTVVSNNVVLSAKNGLILEDSDNFRCPGGSPGHNTVNNNYFGNISGSRVFYLGGRTVCTSSTPNRFGSNFSDGSGAQTNAPAFSCDSYSPGPFTAVAGATAFVNYQTGSLGDLHLKVGSPLIAAGTTICTSGGQTPCTPADDLDGIQRAVTISLGVYEPIQSGSLPGAPTGLTATVQ